MGSRENYLQLGFSHFLEELPKCFWSDEESEKCSDCGVWDTSTGCYSNNATKIWGRTLPPVLPPTQQDLGPGLPEVANRRYALGFGLLFLSGVLGSEFLLGEV